MFLSIYGMCEEHLNGLLFDHGTWVWTAHDRERFACQWGSVKGAWRSYGHTEEPYDKLPILRSLHNSWRKSCLHCVLPGGRIIHANHGWDNWQLINEQSRVQIILQSSYSWIVASMIGQPTNFVEICVGDEIWWNEQQQIRVRLVWQQAARRSNEIFVLCRCSLPPHFEESCRARMKSLRTCLVQWSHLKLAESWMKLVETWLVSSRHTWHIES